MLYLFILPHLSKKSHFLFCTSSRVNPSVARNFSESHKISLVGCSLLHKLRLSFSIIIQVLEEAIILELNINYTGTFKYLSEMADHGIKVLAIMQLLAKGCSI